MLFEENDNSGWDGTYKDKLAPEGVYLYIIRVDCDGDDEKLLEQLYSIIKPDNKWMMVLTVCTTVIFTLFLQWPLSYCNWRLMFW